MTNVGEDKTSFKATKGLIAHHIFFEPRSKVIRRKSGAIREVQISELLGHNLIK